MSQFKRVHDETDHDVANKKLRGQYTAEQMDRFVNTIRVLSADMVEKANSGHPGAPMGCAPIAHVLFSQVMNYSPENPKFFNRDRFVLSNGHSCALLYSMLHLTGYNVTMDDLKQFRQLGSMTPGHPENFVTPGVEVSTGPLGQVSASRFTSKPILITGVLHRVSAMPSVWRSQRSILLQYSIRVQSMRILSTTTLTSSVVTDVSRKVSPQRLAPSLDI